LCGQIIYQQQLCVCHVSAVHRASDEEEKKAKKQKEAEAAAAAKAQGGSDVTAAAAADATPAADTDSKKLTRQYSQETPRSVLCDEQGCAIAFFMPFSVWGIGQQGQQPPA
jgi:hypothetical protein